MGIDLKQVDAARRGDKDSFALVYDAIAPDLYRVALYTLGNSHDAEDVVSETFIEAYKGIGGLRDISRFKSWMMKILMVRCKRKIAGYIKGKQQLDLDSFALTLSDNENISEQTSEQVTLMQAMARLSEQERVIIVLSVVQGYTSREISDMLALPQGTVSSKLHRSLVKLRKMLGAENISMD